VILAAEKKFRESSVGTIESGSEGSFHLRLLCLTFALPSASWWKRCVLLKECRDCRVYDALEIGQFMNQHRWHSSCELDTEPKEVMSFPAYVFRNETTVIGHVQSKNTASMCKPTMWQATISPLLVRNRI
jgi:hypothetical protein